MKENSSDKVKIVTDGIKAQIFVNGQEIKHASKYAITHSAGALPEIVLTLGWAELEIDGEMCLVTLPDARVNNG